MAGESRWVESELNVRAYLQDIRYALDHGARISYQVMRRVDEDRDPMYTNQYMLGYFFQDEDPVKVLARELRALTVHDYIATVRDLKRPNRSPMWEFGKVYNSSDEVYIKIRIELLDALTGGQHTVFVMSFHLADTPFSQTVFPYKKGGDGK